MKNSSKNSIINKILGYLDKNQKVVISLTLLIVICGILLEQLKENGSINIEQSPTFISIIVILSLIIYGIIDLILDKSDHDILSQQMYSKLEILDTMINSKGLDKIVDNTKVEKIEIDANEIHLILDNLHTDLSPDKKSNYSLDDKKSEAKFGLFFDEVHKNINNGKKYVYYLKHTLTINKEINDFIESHNIKDTHKVPSFILIPSDEFTFLSDIYLYKDTNNKPLNAFEWLESIELKHEDSSEQKDKTLFYLQLEKKQLNHLNSILKNLIQKYGKNDALDFSERDFFISNDQINIIEQNDSCKSIFIITRSLKHDMGDGVFAESVRSNILNGKNYVYYLPKTAQMETDIKQMKHEIETMKSRKQHNWKDFGRITFKIVKKSKFHFFTNVFLYEMEDQNIKKGFEYIKDGLYFEQSEEQINLIEQSINEIDWRTV